MFGEGGTILEPPEVWAEGSGNKRINVGINQQDDAIYLTKIIPANFLQNAVGDVFTDLTVNYGALSNFTAIHHNVLPLAQPWSSIWDLVRGNVSDNNNSIVKSTRTGSQNKELGEFFQISGLKRQLGIRRVHAAFDTTSVSGNVTSVIGRVQGTKNMNSGLNQTIYCLKSLVSTDIGDLRVADWNNLISGDVVGSYDLSGYANAAGNFPFISSSEAAITNSIVAGGYTKYALVGGIDYLDPEEPPLIPSINSTINHRITVTGATLEVTFGLSQTITESISVTDTLTKHKIKKLTDSITITSSIIRTQLKNLAEKLSVEDSVIKTGMGKSITESIRVFSRKFKKTTKDNLKENITAGDSDFTIYHHRFKKLTDGITVLSTIAKTSGSFTRTLAEKINVQGRFMVLLNGLNAFWTRLYDQEPDEDEEDWKDNYPRY